MIRPEMLKALMIDLHRSIASQSEVFAGTLRHGGPADRLAYGDLHYTKKELAAFRELKLSDTAISAMKKCFQDGVASVVFSLFCHIDGAGAPDGWAGEWPGITLTEGEDEDAPLYHDAFYEAIEEFKGQRK